MRLNKLELVKRGNRHNVTIIMTGEIMHTASNEKGGIYTVLLLIKRAS